MLPLQPCRQGSIFGYEYDKSIKVGILRRCDPKSCIEQGDLNDAVNSINEMIGQDEEARKTEEQKKKEAEAPSDEEGDIGYTFEEMPEIKMLIKKTEADEAKSKRVTYFQGLAARHVHTHVELVAETEADDVIIQRFKDSAAFKAKGDPEKKSYRCFMFNPNNCGESSSKPHVRPPSLRGNGGHLPKLCMLMLRGVDFQMDDRDMWLIFDAGREGQRSLQMMQSCLGPAHHSIRHRCDSSRGDHCETNWALSDPTRRCERCANCPTTTR